MYNSHNDVILFLISASIKVVRGHFSLALTVCQIWYIYVSRYSVTLKIQVKVTMYIIRNGAIEWLVSTSLKVVLKHFSLALTVFQILNIMISRNFDLKHIGQRHDIQHTPWRYSMASLIFLPTLTVFQILNIMISRNFVTLKIQVKFTVYNIRYGAIQWQISTSIKVVFEHFPLDLTVFSY